VTPVETRSAPSPAQLRWFGLILAAVFGLVGALVWWHHAAVAAQGLWAAGLGLALAYYAVRPLRVPLYLAWMQLVAPIGWVVTHAALALIFYGLITPLGGLLRLVTRDRFGLRRDPSAASYWTAHDPGGDTARYFRQT
jgi:hypothetical protein